MKTELVSLELTTRAASPHVFTCLSSIKKEKAAIFYIIVLLLSTNPTNNRPKPTMCWSVAQSFLTSQAWMWPSALLQKKQIYENKNTWFHFWIEYKSFLHFLVVFSKCYTKRRKDIQCTNEFLQQQGGVCGIGYKETAMVMFILMTEHVKQCTDLAYWCFFIF